MYRENGMMGFYKGLSPCLVRSIPVAGAGILVYELVLETLF
jgi:hypothetical protein